LGNKPCTYSDFIYSREWSKWEKISKMFSISILYQPNGCVKAFTFSSVAIYYVFPQFATKIFIKTVKGMQKFVTKIFTVTTFLDDQMLLAVK
jgi:hypothetical protein